MASTDEVNREQTAATLWALAKLIETGEIASDGSTDTIVNYRSGAVGEVPSLSTLIQRLGDRVFDLTYDADWTHEEREELFWSVVDGTVPEIMDAIRIASLEDGLAAT